MAQLQSARTLSGSALIVRPPFGAEGADGHQPRATLWVLRIFFGVLKGRQELLERLGSIIYGLNSLPPP